jgi:hypothetical protein
MSATRITVSFTGTLNARSEPSGSETGAIVFGARALYAASAWVASSIQGRVNTASWVVLPWQGGQVAKIIGIQVISGPPLRVRLTRQITAQAIGDCAPIFFSTFRDLDAVTLLEIAGDGITPTEFEWLAAGD